MICATCAVLEHDTWHGCQGTRAAPCARPSRSSDTTLPKFQSGRAPRLNEKRMRGAGCLGTCVVNVRVWTQIGSDREFACSCTCQHPALQALAARSCQLDARQICIPHGLKRRSRVHAAQVLSQDAAALCIKSAPAITNTIHLCHHIFWRLWVIFQR